MKAAGRETLPVTVVISSRDRPAMLRDVIERILAGSRLPAEIIAVDQSAHRNTLIAAISPPDGCRLVHISTQLRGLSRGLNLGARLATHDTLLFTHDDILPDLDWCSRMAGALGEALPGGVVTGRVRAGPPEVDGGYAPSLTKADVPLIARGWGGPDLIHPMNLGIRRATLEQAGGWDPRLGPGTPFPGGEDHDLEYRLRDAGLAIHYRPEVVVVHRAWRDRKGYPALRWGYGRGHGAFLAKHVARGDGRALRRFGREVVYRIGGGLACMRSDPQRGAGRVILAAGMLAGAAEWLIRSRRLREIRLRFPSATAQ